MLVLSNDIIDAILIDNTRRNTVQAWLQPRHEATVIHLWLSGNADPGFRGRRVHLEPVEPPCLRPGIPDELDVDQLGPTGRMGMAAGGRAVVEWHSQFGPTRVELDGAAVELFDGPPLEIWPRSCFDAGSMPWDEVPPRGGSERVWTWSDEVLEDLDVIDDVPLLSVFDPPLRLPPSADRDDVQAERMLKTLLARLASEWVSVDLCPHVRPRDSYEHLRSVLREQPLTVPRRRRRRSVEHVMTFECCDACREEMNALLSDDSGLFDD